MSQKYCSVNNCMNTDANYPELLFFPLPLEVERRALWLRLIRREELQDRVDHVYYICAEHFEPSRIAGTLLRRRLKKRAVPILKLPVRRPQVQETQTEGNETSNTLVQTDHNVQADRAIQTAAYLINTLPRVTHLQQDLKNCRKRARTAARQIYTENNFHKLCDRYLTKPLAAIVKAHTKLKFASSGNRSSPEYKQFCINLFYTSPQAYNLLQGPMCLPNVETIINSPLPTSTVISDNLLNILKAKVSNMSKSDKICSVVVGTIHLKSYLYYNRQADKIVGFHEVNGVEKPAPAKYALVVVLRGIIGKWKQPLGFAYIKDRRRTRQVTTWIEKVLQNAMDIGLDVRTLITTLRLEVLADANLNQITLTKPFFIIKGVKIYYIVAPHKLLLSLRDSLLYCDIYYFDSVAKFEYIKYFYEIDKLREIKLAPKLSDSHMKPSASEKSKIHFATELLSDTVAAALSCYIDFFVLRETAKGTVKFIKMINKLCALLMSPATRSPFENEQAFCGSEDQITFMRDMISFFDSIKLVSTVTKVDITFTSKFIEGFQITIMAILQLHDDLKSEGYPCLQLDRLSKDVVVKCFRNNYAKRTAKYFTPLFDEALHSHLVKVKKEGNLSDLSQLLSNADSFEFKIEPKEEPDSVDSSVCEDPALNTLLIERSDYNKIKLPATNALTYIASYLMSKAIKIHQCTQFQEYMSIKDDDPTIDVDEDSGLPRDFLVFIEGLEKCFQWFFNRNFSSKIYESIIETMSTIAYDAPCDCFPISYVKSLFTRIRICIVIKQNNEDYKIKGKKHFNVQNF
ncbi:unnamed protein product [Chrysodeixis includens]|uniref:THAP-type domain-containing protein n=1 Tax=Chrysodeixis includens TaxID=689277 RepID=A0A9P0FVD8_CHRIL|nr:unnamed protein product [Chrysodeixis includens]